MYVYYQSVGLSAIIFFYIVGFIAFLMLMRLYIAVFLCYFKAELRKQSKKELMCDQKENNEVKDSPLSSEKKNEE
jgi:predicted membrane protein